MQRRHLSAIAAVAVLGMVVAVTAASVDSNQEHWPDQELPDQTEARLLLRKDQRAETPVSYKWYIKDHSAFGDYLNMSNGHCNTDDMRRFDDNGVLMREYRDEMHYHPVLSAQCGLKAYGRYYRGREGNDEAVLYADNLIDIQNAEGAFGYPFAYRYYLTGEDLPAGWISGMAQGQAMSLLARVFMDTGDERYLISGMKALDVMATPTEEGGVMTDLSGLHRSLHNYIFFEEYVTDPPNYTLNGFMFALLGLYDWSQIPAHIDANQELARDLFYGGVITLERLLPYYDLGSWSSYDLGYITFGANPPNVSNSYHGVHLYLLNAIHSITGSRTLDEYFKKWRSYLEDDQLEER